MVQLADRVAREDYETLNASARRLGGNYSSFRGNGAMPGFQFRTRESAEAFQKLVAGDTAAAREVAQPAATHSRTTKPDRCGAPARNG